MLEAKRCSALADNVLRPNELLLLLRIAIFYVVQAFAVKKKTQTNDRSAPSRLSAPA